MQTRSTFHALLAQWFCTSKLKDFSWILGLQPTILISKKSYSHQDCRVLVRSRCQTCQIMLHCMCRVGKRSYRVPCIKSPPLRMEYAYIHEALRKMTCYSTCYEGGLLVNLVKWEITIFGSIMLILAKTSIKDLVTVPTRSSVLSQIQIFTPVKTITDQPEPS